jgi:hypothetical protein
VSKRSNIFNDRQDLPITRISGILPEPSRVPSDMSDIAHSSVGYLSHAGDFSLSNSKTLGGVTQLWSDAFARLMAEQIAADSDASGDSSTPALASNKVASSGEPVAGAVTLGKIVAQRDCSVADTQRIPPEHLFLPIAEFEWDLADKPAVPFSAGEMIDQQRNLDFDSNWVRPVVLHENDDIQAGPGPQKRPLHLPIAEFEWDLADKPALPLEPHTVVEQQRHMDYDLGWARPIILQNLRMAA